MNIISSSVIALLLYLREQLVQLSQLRLQLLYFFLVAFLHQLLSQILFRLDRVFHLLLQNVLRLDPLQQPPAVYSLAKSSTVLILVPLRVLELFRDGHGLASRYLVFLKSL